MIMDGNSESQLKRAAKTEKKWREAIRNPPYGVVLGGRTSLITLDVDF